MSESDKIAYQPKFRRLNPEQRAWADMLKVYRESVGNGVPEPRRAELKHRALQHYFTWCGLVGREPNPDVNEDNLGELWAEGVYPPPP